MTTGKWREPDVPHRGWTCVDIYDDEPDDGELTFVCQMCEAIRIRYVHVMQHPTYPDQLHVGCICAGHMEQDLVGAREREKTFRKRRARKERWLMREWRISAAGNDYLNVDGFNVVVFPKGSGWGARIKQQDSGYQRIASRTYGSAEEAKLAAFDAMQSMIGGK